MYDYKARLVRVIDGDTVVMDVDLGCFTHREIALRLFGINAPEMVGEHKAAGVAAKEAMTLMLTTGAPLTIHTYLDRNDKYGRLLADIILANGESANELMVRNGFAVRV